MALNGKLVAAALAVAIAAVGACADGSDETVSAGEGLGATATDVGVISVQLDPIDGFFVEGFEVGLRFETAAGDVLVSTLWTDHVNEQVTEPSMDDYYDTVLRQEVPAGPVVVLATVNIGAGPPPEIPDLEGDMQCRLSLDVPADGDLAVEVNFDGGDDCLRVLNRDESGSPFWEDLSLGQSSEYKNFASLAEMVEYADLIVVGEVTGIADGRAYEGSPGDVQKTASVTIDVAEVLRGEPIAPHGPETVTFERAYMGSLPTIDELPTGRTLVFLRDAERLGLEVGRTPEQAASDRGRYVLVSSQGVLVETPNGVEAPLRSSEEQGFAADYASNDLEHVIDLVRSS